VVNSLKQRFTIASLIMAGIAGLVIGLLLLPSLANGLNRVQKTARRFPLTSGCRWAGERSHFLRPSACWQLRGRTVDPLGVKLLDLVSLEPQDRSPDRLRNVGPQRPVLGWSLIALTLIVIVGVDFISIESVKHQANRITQLGFFGVWLAPSVLTLSQVMPSFASQRIGSNGTGKSVKPGELA
jgi:hypothetical protein